MLLAMGHSPDLQAVNAGASGPWSFLLQLGLCPRPSVTRTPQSGPRDLDLQTPPQHSCLSFPLVPATPSPLTPSHVARVLPLSSEPPQDSSERAPLSRHRDEGLSGCHRHLQDPPDGQEGPSPFADRIPQAQRPAAPCRRPRGKAEAEGSQARWPGPQPWAPAPRAPPPPSCRGLIQACGKRTWLAGTGGPQCLWDALMLQMRPWAPALGGFDELAKLQFSAA